MKIGNFDSERSSVSLGAWRFLTFLFFVGMVVFVLASNPIWLGYDVPYVTIEDVVYYHNLSANISGFDNDITFAFDTDNYINWTNSSGTYSVSPEAISSWINIYNSSSGNLTINASRDNQTGYFIIPIQATNNTDRTASVVNFKFQINATNDAPVFLNLNSSYVFPQEEGGSYTINASDEEEHYPLNFNLTFLNNCTHAAWTGRNDSENCSIFNLSGITSTSVDFNFPNPEYNDVGVYWANFSVEDFNGTCPHAYCDPSSYNVNKSSGVYVLRFDVFSSLTVNVSNCSGVTVMEGDTFNCTIDITTREETDNFNFSSYGFFKNNIQRPSGNNDWFYQDGNASSVNFLYSLNVSLVPDKNDVGNWTINFSVDDGSDIEIGQIDIYVNYTESNVSLDAIDDINLYSNSNFSVDAYDDDLLILDDSVKDEVLNFSSNVSWVSLGSSLLVGGNRSSAIAYVNHSYVLNNASLGVGNYSVMISVSDLVGNMDSDVFVVSVFNNSAPEWNDSSYVSSSYEGDNVYINLSEYVNDSDDSISNLTFSYVNDSRFDSFNLTEGGIINFSSSDVDVGEHLLNLSVSDGKLSSEVVFNFSIFNVADVPVFNDLYREENFTTISNGSIVFMTEDVPNTFMLILDDDDFLILDEHKSYYNESLNVSVFITNSSGGHVDLFNFSFLEYSNPSGSVSYDSTFLPSASDVGNYTVFINVTDVSGNCTNRTFFLDVVSANDAPNLTFVDNSSLTINDVFNLDINASDEENGNDSSGLLEYSLDFIYGDDFVNGDESIFNSSSGIFNLSLNSSYVGEYRINVTVNDSEGAEDSQVFSLFVYGMPNITFPVEGHEFDWKEGDIEPLNFSVDYGVNNSNLTYEFFVDDIVYYWVNESAGIKDFNYSNLSLREEGDFIWNSSVNLSFDYSSGYSDESYGMLKNASLLIYNPDYPELNYSLTWGVNVSHTNDNVSFNLNISKKGPVPKGSTISVNLSDYFSDSDYFDVYYNQKVNFSLETIAGAGYVKLGSSFSDWILNLHSTVATEETVKVVAYEWDDNNISLGSVESNAFVVEFIESKSSSSSTTKTKLKLYSLRIIIPDDVIISDENYIDVPFALENFGAVDLYGIDLSSAVLYNNKFSDDIKISLEETHLDVLRVGEMANYTMRIFANTSRSGKYKATIFANVSSPKFRDWGDFFIDLRRVNESDAVKLLVFTEKLIADNPECLELTELFRRAKEAFDAGNEEDAIRLANGVSSACEDAISANEQIRYSFEGFVEKNLYYISFVTLIIFFVGFILYVYKRVRFNKSVEGVYVR